MLQQHTELLERHTEILEQHTEMHRQHSKLLEDQARTLERHEDMLTQLISIVGSTNAMHTDLQSDVVDLKTIQIRQDKVIETLALRSLEHETDIRYLKRARSV